jgi:hypothetical protein
MSWAAGARHDARSPLESQSVRTFEARLAAASPWLMAGLLAAFSGWLSMTQAAPVCGLHQGVGHCAACYAALALTAIAGMVFARPQPKLARIPFRRSR